MLQEASYLMGRGQKWIDLELYSEKIPDLILKYSYFTAPVEAKSQQNFRCS